MADQPAILGVVLLGQESDVIGDARDAPEDRRGFSNSKCGNSSQYEPLPIINGLRGLDKSRALLYNVAGS